MRWILAVLALWLTRARDGERVRFLGGAEALRGGGLGMSSMARSIAASVGTATVGVAVVEAAVVGAAVVGALGPGRDPGPLPWKPSGQVFLPPALVPSSL